DTKSEYMNKTKDIKEKDTKKGSGIEEKNNKKDEVKKVVKNKKPAERELRLVTVDKEVYKKGKGKRIAKDSDSDFQDDAFVIKKRIKIMKKISLIAALGAAINFVQCLEKSSDRDKFLDLLPLMMMTLTKALNSGEESTVQDTLELLIELVGTKPRILRKSIVEVATIY
nr:importin-5-like [Tanacetum cinerariifolium]